MDVFEILLFLLVVYILSTVIALHNEFVDYLRGEHRDEP